MRVTACILLLFCLPPHITAQEKDRWQRISTFEDSTVDLDTSNVTFGTDFTGRVSFRISLSKPETVPGRKDVKYKSVIETIECRCPERLYRVFAVKRFDSKGKRVDSEETGPTAEWKSVKHGIVMGKLFTSACELIEEKRRNP